MVAFTNSQLYPYQQGTDAPCDAPGVWCDMAAMVDADLYGLSQTLGRINPAIPTAKISRSTSLSVPLPFGALISFEAVNWDTDNMVDFDRSPFRIVPNRLGEYLVTGWVTVVGGASAGRGVSLEIVTGFAGSDGTGGFTGGGPGDTLRFATGDQFFRTATIFRVSTPPTLGFGLLLRIDDVGATVTKADFTAYWISDRTSN